VQRQKAAKWLADATEQSSRYNTNDAATWAFNLQSALSACADLESLLTALQHARINPRRVLKLFKCVESLAALSPELPCYLRSKMDLPELVSTSLADINFRELTQQVQALQRKLNADAAAQDTVTGVFLPEAENEFPELCALREELRVTEEQMSAELINIRVQLKNPTLEFRSLRTGPVSSIEHLIEVPAGSAARIPADWIKSNSTKQVDRYHTPVVLALQDRLYQLRDEIKAASRDAWRAYVADVSEQLHAPLRRAVDALGVLAALLSLSKLCKMPGFVEPVYSNSPEEQDEVRIVGGRHPMVERYLERKGEQVIPNDVLLRRNFQTRSCQIITGPNMGGKSSYVRMIALICLLGQIGAHVPAESAQLCIFDRIFTRMGAGDDLAAGHSTFMSELHRTNYILQRATPRSLVILDELGRGTATNDGLAIAQATLSYCLRRIGSALLFVTHFPQISELVERSEGGEGSPAGWSGDGGSEVLPRGRAANVHMGFLEDTSKTAENGLSEVMFLYKAVRRLMKMLLVFLSHSQRLTWLEPFFVAGGRPVARFVRPECCASGGHPGHGAGARGAQLGVDARAQGWAVYCAG
jgi:DNA mismatch repair protein MSH3